MVFNCIKSICTMHFINCYNCTALPIWQAICTREEYHLENSKNLQDKDQYRKQIREMGERYDELQVQLFRTQGDVLALQAKLRKQKNPIQAVCMLENRYMYESNRWNIH